MKSLIQLLALFCILIMVASCGPTQYASSSNAMVERDVLYENSWDLVELNGTTIARTDDRFSYISFAPHTNTINGYTSCNTLGGTIALTGGNGIAFNPVLGTKNTCTNNTVDASLVPALRNVQSWAIVNDDLVMYRDGRAIARWSPSTYSLEDLDGNWQLAYVSGTELPFDVLYPADKKPTIVFDADNSAIMNGTTGYNTISCPVKLNGYGVAFADCTSTKVACEGPGESMFMDNLKKINHYTFADDNTLVFVTDDNRIMRFTRLK